MKRSTSLLALFCLFSVSIFPQAASGTGQPATPTLPDTTAQAIEPTLVENTLPDGLRIVVAENHASPFVRIDLAFRTGAISQTRGNAGAFHVLEHALLAAHEAGASAEEALGSLAAVDWKADTGAEDLSFDMKIPSSETASGIGLWAAMMSRSSFDAATVEAAKTRAKGEAAAQVGDPAAVYEAAMNQRVFARYPWRRDPIGSEKNIDALTAEALAALKATWLVPSNALLIVAGDVKPAEVLAAATKAFADWKGGPSPWNRGLVPQPKLGVMRPTWFALADPRIPEGLAMAEIRYRGPDLESNPKDAFVADLWAELCSAPDGRFEKAMSAAVPSLHGPVQVQFLSQRDGSVISVAAAIDFSGKALAFRDAEAIKEGFRGSEVIEMKVSPSYFGPSEIAAAKTRMIAARQAVLDTIDGMDSELRFAWCSADLEWFKSWNQGIQSVTREEISDLVNDWVLHNLEVVSVRMSPNDLAKEAAAVADGGFERATPDNSFWWQTR